MSEELRKSTYECPLTMSYEICVENRILDQSEPNTGGGEGIGGGTDL